MQFSLVVMFIPVFLNAMEFEPFKTEMVDPFAELENFWDQSSFLEICQPGELLEVQSPPAPNKRQKKKGAGGPRKKILIYENKCYRCPAKDCDYSHKDHKTTRKHLQDNHFQEFENRLIFACHRCQNKRFLHEKRLLTHLQNCHGFLPIQLEVMKKALRVKFHSPNN